MNMEKKLKKLLDQISTLQSKIYEAKESMEDMVHGPRLYVEAINDLAVAAIDLDQAYSRLDDAIDNYKRVRAKMSRKSA